MAGVKTAYLYDGEDVVQTQHDGVANNVLYVYGPGIDEPLARIEADGTVRYYHADAQGTVLSLVDESAVIKTWYKYTVCGAPTVVGEARGNPYMYTGREYDFETGLYFFRNRYQSPILGRFISEDPLGVEAGLNFYAYVGGDPVNFTDPWGLTPHLGWLKQLTRMSTREIQKSIKSLLKRVQEHEKKLLDPKQCKSRDHHNAEIRNWKEQIRLATEELRRRGGVPAAFSEGITEDEAADRTGNPFDWIDPFWSPGYAY